MELMYPVVILICLVISIALVFFKFNKNVKYVDGKKVANTKYVKESEYYKQKVREYNIFSKIIMGLSAVCIVIASVLVARPVTINTHSEDKYNRDIFLSLDVSASQCEVNVEILKQFKQMIPKIEGDRIGIVIYNTSPLVYCPLTEDYEYVNECLSKIERILQSYIDNNGTIVDVLSDDGAEEATFWNGGVLANSDKKGSSLVGDGLAGAVFSFPDLKVNKERTRIIVYSTDNAVEGDETVSLEDACSLCKNYNIYLYAYAPTIQMNKYATEYGIQSYKKAVEQNAGGKFYTGDLSKSVSSIVNEISETKKSLLKTSKKTYVTDHPEMLLVTITALFLVLIIIEKRVKL